MQVNLFGSITVHHEQRRLDAQSFGGRKPKQLLEILLVRRGHPVSVDELTALLWEGLASAGSTATVQHYVSVLRRKLPQSPDAGSPLLSSRSGYELDLSRFSLDLDVFDAAADAVDRAPRDLRRPLLDLALAQVRGEVLADEPGAAWAVEVRTRYRRRHVHLLLQASAAALAAGEPWVARDHALVAAALEPYAEPATCLLMASHYLAGDQPAALAAFECCRRGLSEVLGIDPMPHTVAMQRAVVARDPAAELVSHALYVIQVQAVQIPRQAVGRARLSA